MPAAASSANAENRKRRKPMPMVTKLAYRHRFHDRLSLTVTLVGIVFSLDYWLFETGAGSALITGALLGIIVGIVIVAKTLYASTKDHINEFATLRALSASAGYIHKVILMQAVLSAVVGYILGMILSMAVIWLSREPTLLIVMTPNLAMMLFGLTIGMCIFAAICAIFKVTRIDPAVVLSR